VKVLRDPALLALYGIAATAVGAFVAVYNGAVFRLSGSPYKLSAGAAGLVFCVYLLGSVGSATAGTLADRYGRRKVVPVGCLITLAGVAITLAAPLPLIVLGLAVMTAGFFAVHGVASGWVPARAHASGVGTAQASSMYLFSFYLGSSVFGGLAGTAWSHGGWTGVALEAGALFTVGLVLSVLLKQTNAKLAR
jgi:YNFM family putative membrane transporter